MTETKIVCGTCLWMSSSPRQRRFNPHSFEGECQCPKSCHCQGVVFAHNDPLLPAAHLYGSMTSKCHQHTRANKSSLKRAHAAMEKWASESLKGNTPRHMI